LDESGHTLDMPRTYGYSKKGKRYYGKHDWGAKGRTNVIEALIGKILFAVGLFNCNVDTMVFSTWVKLFLLPTEVTDFYLSDYFIHTLYFDNFSMTSLIGSY